MSTKTTFGELRSGDYFRFPDRGSTVHAKVGNRYIIKGLIGSFTCQAHVTVEKIGHAVRREPKEVQL